MALPAQVEQDLKDIEELEKQLNAPGEPPEDAEEITDEGKPAEDTEEATQTQDQAPDDTEQATPDSQEAQPQQSEDFEHKYKTLRGKYDAEVPRLHDQVKELTSKLDALTTKLEEQAKQPDPEPEPLVTDADRENFGEDLLDVQRRVAQEVGAQYEKQIKDLRGIIEELQKQLQGTNTNVSELTFEQRLGRLVPDFDLVNKDPKWAAWLDEVDPIIRGPRRVMAQQAFARGDAEAVADYVKMFRDSQAPAQTEQTDAEAELERQVTPSRTTTPPNPQANTNQQPTYTVAQLEAGWDRVTMLNKAGRFDDANKLEAELSAAMVEGRAQIA